MYVCQKIFKPKKYSLEQLAQITSLSINTCMNIKKRSIEKHQQLQKGGLTNDHWENYILNH